MTGHSGRLRLLIAGASALVMLLPAPALAGDEGQGQPLAVSRAVLLEIGDRADKDVRGFYAARGNRPLWFSASGAASPAARLLVAQLRSAELDGLRPAKLKADAATKALDRARSGDPEDLAKAELTLSAAYVRYVSALRRVPRPAMLYEGPALAPVVPTAAAALTALADAPSLETQVRSMSWMHPYYAPLREALAAPGLRPEQARTIALNLARLRAVPAIPSGKWVLVDAASARLWMFEGPRAVDSMKVVVGKRETPTPEMAGFLREAVVNPYWNLPDDLVPSRVTDKVLASGPGVVTAGRFQVLESWEDDAAVLDPRKVDWRAVAENRQAIRVRQLPGAGNFMGAVKFNFANPQGIYLHDTPERDLLAKPLRQFSNGCVRLENASRFGRWLMGAPLPRSKTPERRIDLPQPVPIYLTYLTVRPENGRIVFTPDVYGRDGSGFASGEDRVR